jgi:hypothetical protein
MAYTSIQIQKNTRELLKAFRITKLETYDEILHRLMNNHNKKETRVPSPDPDPNALIEQG